MKINIGISKHLRLSATWSLEQNVENLGDNSLTKNISFQLL